jgi:hypothetical protein
MINGLTNSAQVLTLPACVSLNITVTKPASHRGIDKFIFYINTPLYWSVSFLFVKVLILSTKHLKGSRVHRAGILGMWVKAKPMLDYELQGQPAKYPNKMLLDLSSRHFLFSPSTLCRIIYRIWMTYNTVKALKCY